MHIAIIGCGQLSRMLALAGIAMGFKFSFIADAQEDSRCVKGLGKVVQWQPNVSVSELYAELEQPNLVTAEKEQVAISLLHALQAHCPVHPNPQAFSACQHRHREKKLLDQLNIPCAPYIYGPAGDAGNAQIPLPKVVKSCSEGYDGNNQWVLRCQQDIDAFSAHAKETNYIIEQWIPFDKEISQVSARGANGEIQHYPLTENYHEQGILKHSIAPATAISKQLACVAQDYISRIMDTLNYVGVIAMECFLIQDQLLINELAPRVHNSGHWTQSGSVTCQFENHLRAISGLSLGSTRAFSVTGMINLIGTEKPPIDLLTTQSSLHWYDKLVRPGRKLGHINIFSEDYDSLQQQIKLLQSVPELV